MKLLRIHILSAASCGGLLDDFKLWFRHGEVDVDGFDPLCFIGPNGSGKSQLLQVVAEVFQLMSNFVCPDEEPKVANAELCFEIEYLIRTAIEKTPKHIKASRKRTGKKKYTTKLEMKEDGNWVQCNPSDEKTKSYLPEKVVGYTSGDNETLSLPFLISRSGYANEVGTQALKTGSSDENIPDTRLMFVDYGTNLEVLVASQLLSSADQIKALLSDFNVERLHSCRCIVQLAHAVAPKAPRAKRGQSSRKGIQLTNELEKYLDQLKRCSTCHDYVEKTETYTFDYWINDETKSAFSRFWTSALDLYRSLHKLAMLNDLAMPAYVRKRFMKDVKERRFASRLPEPQNEDKVFRFEQVKFISSEDAGAVDYVSLSDGEHQLGQLLGTMAMQDQPGVLFLLDEPESHFNPQWRRNFISRLLSLPVDATLDATKSMLEQECLLTTHAPFVPSDMSREKVFIFSKENGKVSVRHPDIETFGTTFDNILEECFGVEPPISRFSLDEIQRLQGSGSAEEIENALGRLGNSVEKAFLVDHLMQIKEKED